MAQYDLKQTKGIFATTLSEAERFIELAKEKYGESVTKSSIQQKVKRTKEEEWTYYLASVEVTHNQLRDII